VQLASCFRVGAGQLGGSEYPPSSPQPDFAALPRPLAERILYGAFIAGGRDMATRAQLGFVCKCALTSVVLHVLVQQI